jgi:hypothetical protein
MMSPRTGVADTCVVCVCGLISQSYRMGSEVKFYFACIIDLCAYVFVVSDIIM